MTNNVLSIDDFKARQAAKEQEREENYAKIPKVSRMQGGAVGGAGRITTASSGESAPVDTNSVLNHFSAQLELLEQAIHALASAADPFVMGHPLVRKEHARLLVTHEEKDEFARWFTHLATATQQAWGAYNAVRAAQRAGCQG